MAVNNETNAETETEIDPEVAEALGDLSPEQIRELGALADTLGEDDTKDALDAVNQSSSRRGFLKGAGTIGLAGLVGAGSGSAAAGGTGQQSLSAGSATLAEATQVSDREWIGPTSTMPDVEPKEGRVFKVIDDGPNNDLFKEYYGDGASWQGNGWKMPSLDTDEGVIRDPSVAPNAEAQGQAQIATGLSDGDKTKLLSPADTSWTSQDIAWGSIWPAHKYLDNPQADYYLYYAEDHVNNAKIGVAFRDGDPIGPYSDYGSNPIITSYTNQETPSPVWNAADSRQVLFAHSKDIGTTQSTVALTSTDGLTFTDQGLVVDTPDNTPGNGHTGYFSPNRFGGAMWGYHLLGGTNQARFGMSYPDDSSWLSWTTDPRPIGNQIGTTGDRNRRVEMNLSNIVSVGGAPYWVGVTSGYSSGTTYSGKKLAAAPLANKRRLARRPRILATAGTESWEGNGITYPRTVVDHNDRRLYSTYTSGGSIGAIDLGRVY